MKIRLLIALCATIVALACERETSRIQSEHDAATPPESLTIGMPSDASTSAEPLADTDVDFVMNVARAGMHEVNAGRIAVERATDARVRQFAQRMIQDHGRSSQELSSIAQSNNLGLPVQVGAHAAEMEKKLSGLSGAEFDREYMKAMVDDHRKAVEMMRSAEATSTSAEIKDFASRTLPVIEDHLRTAQKIASSLGATN